MLTDCRENVEAENRLVKANVTRLGVRTERVSDAIEFAAEKLTCVDANPNQLKSFRLLIGRLIAHRVARLDGDEPGAKRHLKQHFIVRSKLINSGFSDEEISDLCAGITQRLSA